MAGKKKHKLKKQHQKDNGQESYSSGEDSQMDSSGKTCPHLTKAVNLQCVKKVIKGNVNFDQCQLCSIVKHGSDSTEDNGLVLWLCLQCGNIGCGRYSEGKHAMSHYQTPRSDSHAVCLNLSSWSVWCYDCDEDVMLDSNKKLLECVEFLKKHVKSPSTTSDVLPVVDTAQSQNNDLCSGSKSNLITEDVTKENGGKSSTENYREEPSKLSTNGAFDNLPSVKGLVNLGNTCFFNAVLQCLSQTHILSELIDVQCNQSTALTLRSNDLGLKVTADIVEPLSITLDEVGPLTLSLASFLKEANSMSRFSRSVNPGHLFGQVCKKAPQFRGMMQQDSHELLRHLLDGLKSEEIKRYQAGILEAFGLAGKINQNNVDIATRAKLKSYNKLVPQTLVDQLFSGQLISTVVCEECQMSSQVFEPFLDLSLPVMEEKVIRPIPVKKNSIEIEANITGFEKVEEKPSKYQEKKAKKQAKREAKVQRNKAKQQRRRTISIGDAASDVASFTDSPITDGVASVRNETDADSTNNSIETKNDSDELSDADVEDNEESESISSLNTNAPSIVGGKKLEDDDCWPRGSNRDLAAQLPFHETEHESVVDDLCLKVKGLQLRQDSLLEANEIVPCEAKDWEGYNGHQGETKTGDEDKTWSSSDDSSGEFKSGKKLAGQALARKEWVNKSMTTLSPRYQVSSHECSVFSCLNKFTAVELLTGNNKFGCDFCTKIRDEEQGERPKQGKSPSSEVKNKTKIYTNASKQLLVFSPPAILTLHLKRFEQVGFSLRKVHRHIDFPLIFDLAPYCSRVCLGLPTLKKGQQRVLYSLYAVVEHSGRLTGGHYTAYVKVRQQKDTSKEFLNEKPSGEYNISRLMDIVHEKLRDENSALDDIDLYEKLDDDVGHWFHISDGHVSQSSEASVLKCQAYILFYERVF